MAFLTIEDERRGRLKTIICEVSDLKILTAWEQRHLEQGFST